ncbi:MAG: DUF5302 domain-containing protein [Candidatus Nanopelagicales bacterium]
MTASENSAPSEPTIEGSSAQANDPKEQMRIALERKNQKNATGQAHLDGHAKATGEHGKAGGGRQFRRKSG